MEKRNGIQLYHTMGYLHTNSDFNRPAAYSIFKDNKTKTNTAIAKKLEDQAKQMEIIEQSFYKKMGCEKKTFYEFMEWLRGLVKKQDALFLTELSSTLKSDELLNSSLYDYYKKEISMSEVGMNRDTYIQARDSVNIKGQYSPHFKKRKFDNLRYFKIETKVETESSINSRLKLNQVKQKKGEIKIDVLEIVNNLLQSDDFKNSYQTLGGMEKLYREVIKILKKKREQALEQYNLLTYETTYKSGSKKGQKRVEKISAENYKDINYEKVYRLLQPSFYNALKNAGYPQETVIDLLEIGIRNKKSKEIIQGDLKKMGTDEDELFLFFRNKMLSYRCTDELLTAFEKVWLSNLDVIQANIKKGASLFTGGLGELSGMVLVQYILIKTNNEQLAQRYERAWTATKKVNGEDMKADIMLKDLTGIQVKNYSENMLKTKNVDINLHPYQILDRLIANGEINQEQEKQYATAFANMSFNRSSFNLFYSSMKVALKPFLASLANFSLDDTATTIINDTNNIWLIGGSFLIPGSEILKMIANKLRLLSNKKWQKDSMLTFTSSNQRDDSFFKKDKHSNILAKYWILKTEEEDGKTIKTWEPTEENNQFGEFFQKEINSNKLSTHIYINLSEFVYDKEGFKDTYRIF